jgi:kynureninase
MSVERTQRGHQIRYELRHDAALVGVLIFGQPEIDPAAWKMLLPGPGGTEDLYGTERFQAPDARQLRAWLTPVHEKRRTTMPDETRGPAPTWQPPPDSEQSGGDLDAAERRDLPDSA